MDDYKMHAAEKALELITPGQTIGLGDGTTVLYLAALIAANHGLSASLTFATSSGKTASRLAELGLALHPLQNLKRVDIYFDGCDQFDRKLNALKSGSGIHTMEKILAAMADNFILIGDDGKFSESLTSLYPVVVEIIPAAQGAVTAVLQAAYPYAAMDWRHSREAGNNVALTERGNYLLEIKFKQWPELARLNTFIKMLPGVVDHSLFYQLASKAIVSGEQGTRIIFPQMD